MSLTQKKTDVELIDDTLSGDKAAFGMLVIRHQKKVYMLIHRIIKSTSDVSDLVQETFIHAYQNLEYLREKEKFSSWLYQIAKNQCINWLHKCQRNLAIVEDELIKKHLQLSPKPDEILIQRELYQQVMKAVSKLPEHNRKAVEMFYFEGRKYLDFVILDFCV